MCRSTYRRVNISRLLNVRSLYADTIQAPSSDVRLYTSSFTVIFVTDTEGLDTCVVLLTEGLILAGCLMYIVFTLTLYRPLVLM